MILLPPRGLLRIVQNLTTDGDATVPASIADTTMQVQVCVVNQLADNSNGFFYVPDDMSLWEIEIGVGNPDAAPVGGFFTLTWTTQTTGQLAFSASASTIASALNGLSGFPGCTVVSDGAVFLVTFTANGNQVQITGDPTGLAPLCVVQAGTPTAGTSGSKEVQSLRLLQAPATFLNLDSSDLTPAAAGVVTVLQVGGGGKNHRLSVALTPQPYTGQWAFTIAGSQSALIDWNAAASVVQTALEGMSSVGTGNVSVSQAATSQWLIGFQGTKANTNMGPASVDPSGLSVIRYLSGVLDFNVPGVQLLLAGDLTGQGVATFFQMKGARSGGPTEALYGPVSTTLLPSVITDASLTPQPANLYYTQAQANSRFAPLQTGWYRIGSSGKFELFNMDTGDFYPITVQGALGAEYLAIGAADPVDTIYGGAASSSFTTTYSAGGAGSDFDTTYYGGDAA